MELSTGVCSMHAAWYLSHVEDTQGAQPIQSLSRALSVHKDTALSVHKDAAWWQLLPKAVVRSMANAVLACVCHDGHLNSTIANRLMFTFQAIEPCGCSLWGPAYCARSHWQYCKPRGMLGLSPCRFQGTLLSVIQQPTWWANRLATG